MFAVCVDGHWVLSTTLLNLKILLFYARILARSTALERIAPILSYFSIRQTDSDYRFYSGAPRWRHFYLEFHVAVSRILCRKLVLNRNKRLSAQNDRNPSPKSVRWVGKEQCSPEQKSDSASSKIVCATTIISEPLLLQTDSEFTLKLIHLPSFVAFAEITNKLRLSQMSFRMLTDPWSFIALEGPLTKNH